MIFVLLGTQNNSFKRLLVEIENLISNGIIKEEVIVQAGHTKYETDKMKVFDMISLEELEKYQTEADLIITHGGVGSIFTSIKKEKKVIAVARLSKYGEHVNDHQKEIVNAFNQKEYLIGIEDVSELKDALEKVKNFKPKKYELNNKKMLNTIEKFIEKIK